MSPSCLRARDLFPLYADEALGAAERSELRKHVASCEPCRAEAERFDEGLLFAFAGTDEVSSEDVERILRGVRAGLDWKRVESRLPDGRPHRRRGFLAAAVALVALTLAFPGTAPRPSAVSAAAAPPAAAWPNDSEPALGATALPASDISNPQIPAKATIYDWNPGSGEPRVVWIVDRSLDI